MFRLIQLALPIAISFASAGVLQAQTGIRKYPFDEYLTEERVREALEHALENIHTARCESAVFCAPASPEELSTPPISASQARAAMKAGLESGMAAWCGLHWRQSFLTGYLKVVLKMNERQIALLTLLYGIQRDLVLADMKDKSCSPEERSNVDAQLSGRG